MSNFLTSVHKQVYRASNNIDAHDIITTTLRHIVAPLMMDEGIAVGG